MKTRIKYILCGKIAGSPARELRDSMQKILGERILVTSNPDVIKNGELFMRYGNSSPVSVKDTEWNTREFVHICSDKRVFSNLMKDNGIYSPEFFKRDVERTYPVLIRETLHGYGGAGIHYVEDEENFTRIWQNQYWWTPFKHLQFEMRAHVVDGTVIKLYTKKLDIDKDIRIMTNENSHWSRISEESLRTKYDKLKLIALRIGELTGGRFFGLDIGWDQNKKEYFVLEANSAPGLNLISSNEYASSILRGMGYDLRTETS